MKSLLEKYFFQAVTMLSSIEDCSKDHTNILHLEFTSYMFTVTFSIKKSHAIQ